MHVFKKFLYNTYSRTVIFLFIRGICLPGFQKIQKEMGASYQKYERQKLIQDIKGERFRLRVGPLWLRSVMEKIFLFFQQNKFVIRIFSKITISLVCISIPVYLFILVRGVLPVPERVPYEIPLKTLSPTSNIHVDFPYTEGTFTKENSSQAPRNFGIGFFPVKLNILRGFLVSEQKELLVRKIYSSSFPMSIVSSNFISDEYSPPDDKSTLRIGYYLYPSGTSKQASCVLQIFNSNHELLAQTKDITPNIESYSKYSIRNSWRKAFTPNVIPAYGHIGELKISISAPPEEIIVKSFNPNPIGADSALEPKCTFVVSDFSFEHPTQKPLPRRGVIFIVLDSLRANTAYDKNLMPKLNKYIKNGGVVFLEHRAQSNETFLSMSSLLTSHYPGELDSAVKLYSSEIKMQQGASERRVYKREAHTQATSNDPASSFPISILPLELQNLGYRVGAIGSVSHFTDAVAGGVDMGIHNGIVAEHSRYEGRHITELSGQWLEKYGDAPFFLYLHYNTMDNPYKPPFANIDLLKLMRNPFGLNQKQQLYKAVARYLDTELKMLFKKLKALGILENVDIILTSDHGVQMDKKDWYYVMNTEQKFKGAYASKGHSLFDEEIRVPLMMKIAGHAFPKDTQITAPSAHLDLFPTLYSFMGGDLKTQNMRGLNFSKQLLSADSSPTFSDVLAKRKCLFFEALRYSGVIAWDTENLQEPTKYVRQLAKDSTTFYLTHTPWEKFITWYQPELYSKINFNLHKEYWMKHLQDSELDTMRKIYAQNFVNQTVLNDSENANGNNATK